MSRRRQSRKRRRAEQKQRPGDPAPSAAPPPPAPASPRNISWTGLLGGLAGALPMAAIAVVVIIDPGRGQRWWAAIFAAVALLFVPAAWASVARTPYRQRIQKATTVGCIVLAAAGILFFGIGFAMILTVPTTLLAIASGLVFQGGEGRK